MHRSPICFVVHVVNSSPPHTHTQIPKYDLRVKLAPQLRIVIRAKLIPGKTYTMYQEEFSSARTKDAWSIFI